jgi:1-acyl-sn-glycerol-3-phosphate acyltransferase
VSGGWLLRRFGRALPRAWAKGCLWLMGVRVEVAGGERLASRRSCLVVYNHASTLDTFLLWALMPDRGLPIIKREMLRYPVLGLGMLVLDVIALDRSDPAAARASMAEAAQRMAAEPLAVFLAPEGRRSRDGGLRPFKPGMCHLAAQAGCPIVPLVIHGAFERLPTGRWYAEPGVVRVEVLEPIATDGFHPDAARADAAAVRERFVAALAGAHGEAPSGIRGS